MSDLDDVQQVLHEYLDNPGPLDSELAAWMLAEIQAHLAADPPAAASARPTGRRCVTCDTFLLPGDICPNQRFGQPYHPV
jgi:hypothetical protein